jgi:uncharacterized protein YeaC (DUF1315 family)
MSEIDDTQNPELPEKPGNWNTLVASMSPELHASLKTAVELGRWPNGDRLTPQQREHCLQAVIAWDQLHLPEDERVGYIDRTALQKSHCDD